MSNKNYFLLFFRRNVPYNNDVDETKITREKSIAHHIFFHKAVFISFDIETGEENF